LDVFLSTLGIELPIILAPVAGVSAPHMAAATDNCCFPRHRR
jgi:NAD(P)H-dependent flavin oxidoreductase YrpB (nitropropane dioxygenase family)